MFTKNSFWKQILQKVRKPELHREAFFAYYHKLPANLQVEWIRDSGMIVGKVTADGKEFMTQGTDADDFIKMVNESLLTIFNIPHDYFDVLEQTGSFSPGPTEKKLLEDNTVHKSKFGVFKPEREPKFA